MASAGLLGAREYAYRCFAPSCRQAVRAGPYRKATILPVRAPHGLLVPAGCRRKGYLTRCLPAGDEPVRARTRSAYPLDAASLSHPEPCGC
jgi:hypothetical protein